MAFATKREPVYKIMFAVLLGKIVSVYGPTAGGRRAVTWRSTAARRKGVRAERDFGLCC